MGAGRCLTDQLAAALSHNVLDDGDGVAILVDREKPLKCVCVRISAHDLCQCPKSRSRMSEVLCIPTDIAASASDWGTPQPDMHTGQHCHVGGPLTDPIETESSILGHDMAGMTIRIEQLPRNGLHRWRHHNHATNLIPTPVETTALHPFGGSALRPARRTVDCGFGSLGAEPFGSGDE